MKNIDEIPTSTEVVTKLYNMFLYVISFENYIISTLAILLVFSAILHLFLTFTSEKYNKKITKINTNKYFIWPSIGHLKLGLIGVILFILLGVIYVEK